MAEKLQPVRGTQDFLPEMMARYRLVCDTAHKVTGLYGFEEMATPIFEQTAVFSRSIGEATDVVSKEMYTFSSRSGGESLTLRPENTAGVARAVISNSMLQSTPHKFFYAGPMFRYERPQKGRYRQFHQIGAELIGVEQPLADVEVIASGAAVLRELGLLDRVTLKLNSLGDPESRAEFRSQLVEYFSAYLDELSDESKDRLVKNPLRILDSKNARDQEIAQGAPKFGACLNQKSLDFFAAVKQGLDDLGIKYELDETLVRGLDYYTHTAFEFVTSELGAQSGVLGGGRYDGLIGNLGATETPGVGWASGVERLMLLMECEPEKSTPIVIVPMGDAAERQAAIISEKLRRAGLHIDQGYKGNMGKRLKRADKLGANLALILGQDELDAGQVVVKNLKEGSQQTVALDQLEAFLKSK
ncbi:MAG: histidine--tRNA ligase [Alphaproteobacteria bacterium]